MRSFSRCGQAYGETARDQWVKEWPGQVVICTSQMFWTLEVHEAIKAGANVGLYMIYSALAILFGYLNHSKLNSYL